MNKVAFFSFFFSKFFTKKGHRALETFYRLFFTFYIFFPHFAGNHAEADER